MHEVYLSSSDNWFPQEYKFKDLLAIYKVTYPEFDMEFAQDLIKVFDVNVKQKYSKASTGYKSIMKIILALANPSEYIFLDEPVLGLMRTTAIFSTRSCLKRMRAVLVHLSSQRI